MIHVNHRCRGKLLVVALCFALFLALPTEARAQTLYGSITGNVRDASDAAIVGAQVTITNKSTNQTRTAATNETGTFSLATVQTGTYEVTVSMAGFKKYTESQVNVTLNTLTRIDVKLDVGELTETVTVAAEVAQLQTDRAEVKSEIVSKVLRDLPVVTGRNYQGLFVTLPGITPPQNAHSIPSNPSRALTFNVNGATTGSNNIRIDGASQYNIWLPHVTAYVPALESIETVNIVTNSFDAEQGLAAGAAVNVQIKSGTNDMHGSAFEYHQDNALKAKPFFSPQGARKPKLVYNQFGATFGGPIKKDKLFYFASYEGTTDRQFASRFFTVPTMAQRRGDMSASTNPIYDPDTGNLTTGAGRTPFAGNLIPDNRIDPIARKIFSLLPAPTGPGEVDNFYGQGSFAFTRNTIDAKVNWNATSKFTMYGRFSLLKYTMDNPPVFGDLGGPGASSYAGNVGHGWGNTIGTTIAGTYAFSSNFIVDANFGYTRMYSAVEQPRLDEKLGLDFLGIPGTNGPRRFEGGWPRFTITDFANMGVQDNFMPYYRTDPQWVYVANANWTKGKHNVRFGMDWAHQQMNHTQPEFPGAEHGAQGGFTFGGGPTQIQGGPGGNRYNNVATFLLGYHTVAGRILQVPDVYTTRVWQYSYYIRDQWQVTPKLTFTFGTRYERFPYPYREDRGVERYDFENNKMFVCGVGVVPKDCGVEQSNSLFAPRVGLAYRPTDKMVIRAGYGLTNDPYSLARHLRTNHPILLALNVTAANSLVAAGKLKDGIPTITAPDLGNGIIDVPTRVAINSTLPEYVRGYVQSWNLTLEKELLSGFTGQVGYVGTRQIKQLGFLDLNAGRVGGGNASKPFNQKFGRNVLTRAIGPIGNSIYDSMQAGLQKRFSNGYQLQASYTWSKSLGIANTANSDGDPNIKIPEYYHLNYGVTPIHTPHNFQLTSIIELPFGQGKRWANSGGAASAILGGWQVNNIVALIAGQYFTVNASGTSLDAPENTQRADYAKEGKPVIVGGAGPGQSFFDPFFFKPVTGARFGTSSFNSVQGPGAVNLDFGLFRNFRISERIQLQFRAEAFNLTNTPHFANPPDAGRNVSNMILNTDGSIRSLGGYTVLNAVKNGGREGVDERVFRFGVRLSF
jgi:hypothetical protein